MLHRSSPPRSFETRVESERRLTGTESHQSRRAGLRGVEHAETQTDGARGSRRRRAHALGRARRAAGHVPESSAHGRAEKNVSVIRGVEITHCVRSRRGIRAIVSRSRLRLVGSTLARVRRFASSSRASSPPHRASARPREESRVAESLPARRATDRPNEDVTARARSRDETPRSAVFSRGVASSALAPRLLARTHRLSINSAPDRSPGAPGRRRRRPSRVVVVAGGCVDRAGDLGGRQSSARESARANAGEIDDARVDRRTRDEGGRLARGGATRRRGTISNDF